MLQTKYDSIILSNYYMNNLDTFLEKTKHDLNSESILIKLSIANNFKHTLINYLLLSVNLATNLSSADNKDLMALINNDLIKCILEIDEIIDNYNKSQNPFENPIIKNIEFKIAYILTRMKNIQLYLFTKKKTELKIVSEEFSKIFYSMEKLIK